MPSNKTMKCPHCGARIGLRFMARHLAAQASPESKRRDVDYRALGRRGGRAKAAAEAARQQAIQPPDGSGAGS